MIRLCLRVFLGSFLAPFGGCIGLFQAVLGAFLVGFGSWGALGRVVCDTITSAVLLYRFLIVFARGNFDTFLCPVSGGGVEDHLPEDLLDHGVPRPSVVTLAW